ncbi:MAG: preprotein translocase subunit SecE [Christensenellales bacterium]
MAKKNVQPASEEVEVIAPDVQEKTAEVEIKESNNSKKSSKKESKENVNDGKNTKDKTKDKAKNKPKKEKKSLKKKVAEIWSELKKVSKPSFGKVVKNTCVVIAVVAICTLFLFGVDKLFSLIYDLLLP